MPPRLSLPADDLYVRLGVPRDASPEAIDLAWRGLLRKHHPDVAGDEALELAKRINIAPDWLADPDLRRRYDRERGSSIRSGRSPWWWVTRPVAAAISSRVFSARPCPSAGDNPWWWKTAWAPMAASGLILSHAHAPMVTR